MECRIKKLRDELDTLGYYQSFTSDSAPLIENLLSDLKTTTGSLQKYMNVAQNALEEKNNLELGAEPYKCDNAKLVRECNHLHLNFMHQKEENEKIQKDLKRRLESLKNEVSDCNTERQKLKNKIKDLELELVQREEILLHPKLKNKTNLKTSSTSALIADKSNKKTRSFEINSAMALADQKITNLSKEVKKLNEHNLQMMEANELLQSQLNGRDKEIKRLNSLLEGGRPLNAIRKDCSCTKQAHGGFNMLQDELNKILQEKIVLESRLKESIAKQHEAMKRALHLAERNKHLESEMKDLDRLALAVESECNNTIKSNTEKVNRLQDRMQESVMQIQTLERENKQLKQEKQGMCTERDAVLAEKRHLQSVLETSLEEKKRLTDKINNFTIIEQDLNMEIDRLTRLSAEQKRKIMELEASLTTDKAEQSRPLQDIELSKRPGLVQNKSRVYEGVTSSSNRNKVAKSPEGSPSRRNKPKKKIQTKKSNKTESPTFLPQAFLEVPTNTPQDISPGSGRCCNCHCNSCLSSKHLKELLDKELDYREQQATRCIDSLKQEKDYYMREYHKVLEQMKTASRSSSGSRNDKTTELLQKLAEKEHVLAKLEHENQALSKEKFNLISRLDSAREIPESPTEGPCLKASCKRIERERDILRSDIERLEEEVQAWKYRLKNVSDTQIGDQERLQRRLNEAEEQVHKLEQENRELLQNQGTRRAAIDTLEEQCDTVRDQLKLAQTELTQQRALYNQLKNLQEQTDRALSDTQSKLVQAETELATTFDSLKQRDLDRGAVNKEVDLLKNDIQIMKSQLQQMDEEKDELLMALDDKTEKMARLETELKSKEKTIESLENTVGVLKKKLSLAIDEGTGKDQAVRSSQTELFNLRQELDTIKQIRDGAVQENRRLQNDLSAVTSDCRDARKELEMYKRQVEDLKTQLQQYIAEVKRTEDLISNKEIERNELLDQFRSLSHEANILESNNHTLENEATQSRVQLSVALDHASDLERKLENKDSIIHSYEKQIADMTSQIASLEMQLRQYMSQYDRAESELLTNRELSTKLDSENAKIRRQLRERDEQRLQMDQLRSERETTRDRRNVENIEKDLQEAKHETTELQMLNQDLQGEVHRLKIQVKELRDKFAHTAEQLDMYQEKALEYSQQNKQLRREIANERFRRTRDSESSKYPSL